MRIPMNLFLVNLAVADITVAVFVAIQYIFTLMFTLPRGKVGDIFCQLVMFMWVGASVSAFSLACIALERYLAVKFPYNKYKRITTNKVKCMILVIWVLAVICNMPQFLYARYDPVIEFSVIHWPSDNLPKFYGVASATMYGVLPITIVVYLYSKLLYKLWFRPITSSTLAQQSNLMYCKKTARLVVTVSVVYFVCWTPTVVIYALPFFTSQLQLHSSVHMASIVLVTLNSAINPVLYSLQSDRFRKHMLALLPFCCWSRRRSRVVPANLDTSTNAVLRKMEALNHTNALLLESRGPTA